MFNVLKLYRELVTANIPVEGCDVTGKIDFLPEATSQQIAQADVIKAAHDPTDYVAQDMESARQQLLTQLDTAITLFTNNDSNWATLTVAEKDANHRALTRAMARLLRWHKRELGRS